jgi:hypothetical protein
MLMVPFAVGSNIGTPYSLMMGVILPKYFGIISRLFICIRCGALVGTVKE